jgi:integrase
MALTLRGKIWWYRFSFEGQFIQESAKTKNRSEAQEAELNRKRELRDSLMGVENRQDRTRTIKEVGQTFLADYKLRYPHAVGMPYEVDHVTRRLGAKMISQIDIETVREYQRKRRSEDGAAPKTINGEVSTLFRIMEKRGDMLREEFRRRRLNLKVENEIGKAYSDSEMERMFEAAKSIADRSPSIHFALRLALNGGMRDAEIKKLRWSQIDFTRNILTVGKAKTKAGTGRLVPLNGELLAAFIAHRDWYLKKFLVKNVAELNHNWYVFPFGRRGYMEPQKPVTTFKTAWTSVRAKAGVTGRWHDTRHTVVSDMLEAGASAATVKATVGHVSNRILERYTHANVDAQRRAVEAMSEYRKWRREDEAKRRLKVVA